MTVYINGGSCISWNMRQTKRVSKRFATLCEQYGKISQTCYKVYEKGRKV